MKKKNSRQISVKTSPKFLVKLSFPVTINKYNIKNEITKSITNLILPKYPSECGLSFMDLVYPSHPEIMTPHTNNIAAKFVM